MTAPATTSTGVRQLSAEALAVMERFPPRPVPASWQATAADRFAVARRLLAPPFLADDVNARHWRKRTMLKVLDWLGLHPGTTWQQRWKASGAGADGPRTGATGCWMTWMTPACSAAGTGNCITGSVPAWSS